MIITEFRNGETVYNSSSPDEIALANFAKYCGFEFQGMNSNGEITTCFNGKQLYFKLHHLIEFDSSRKRQSIIFEEADKSVWIYTKGADNVILERSQSSMLQRYSISHQSRDSAAKGKS